MNVIALRLGGIGLTIAIFSLLFTCFFKKELVQRVKQDISWLLKISFFDFVQLLVFLKPLKKYTEQIGIFLWFILVFLIGKYLIIEQPKLTDISGPYIPLIGYVYYLSVLFIINFMLQISKKVN